MVVIHLATLLGVVALTTANVNITSPPITNWGVWGPFQRCPFGRHAQGFQLRTEPNQYLGDDTALNAIRLFCGDPFRPDTPVITSTVGQFGDWGNVYTCYPGVLNGFQLRSESDRGSGDDTAANNIRFFCSSSSNPNDYIQGDGMSWGDWTAAQRCYGGQAIAGIQTQVEPYLDTGDDTMLNNVLMECRDYSAAELQADYDRAKEIGSYPQEVSPKFADFLRKAIAKDLKFGENEEGKVVSSAILPKLAKAISEAADKEAKNEPKPLDLAVLLKKVSEATKNEQLKKSGN